MRKLLSVAILGTCLWAEGEIQFAPPPAAFLGNYNPDKPQGKVGFMFLNYQTEGLTLNGAGMDGSGQVALNENVWLGGGIGLVVFSGQDDAQTYDITMSSMPMNFVVGLRLPVDETMELGLIAGPVLGMSSATISTAYGDTYVDTTSAGIQAGVIVYMGMGGGLGFTPYFLTQEQSGDVTVTSGGYETTATYDFSSQTVGFDITFGTFSLGAMVQALEKEEEESDLTMFRFSATF